MKSFEIPMESWERERENLVQWFSRNKKQKVKKRWY